MAQYGSITTISSRTRLILLDCFETVVELVDGMYRPRLGIVAFIQHFAVGRSIPLVIISDADEATVEATLKQAEVRGSFSKVYHAGNAIETEADGRLRKRLDIPLADFAVRAPFAMFIGDSPLDAMAAQHHGVPFIRVPRSEDRAFTFASLISGPSRYDSGEFSATFLDEYRKRLNQEPK